MWFRSRRSRVLLIGVVLVVAAGLGILAQPRARTALRWVRGFSALERDPRVYCETGAEDFALAIADALPAAVARVEECQAEPFASPFRVYVCATHESFARRIGHPDNSPVRGIAFHRDIWVSPKAFSFHGEDTHRETVMHELSHLHFGQQLSWWRKTKGVPSWFLEGLADWVADTGDEQVTYSEARQAILGGRHFEPEATGRLPVPRQPKDYGLTWPMFHRQSRMFVEYLRSRDPDAFVGFVAAVVHGVRFETAFEENFSTTPADAWKEFVASLKHEEP